MLQNTPGSQRHSDQAPVHIHLRILSHTRSRLSVRGDGESSSIGRYDQQLWQFDETGLAVPSLVGREGQAEGRFVRNAQPVRQLLLHNLTSGAPAGLDFVVRHRAVSPVVSTARNHLVLSL